MTEKTKKIVGWVLSGLFAAFLAFGAFGKLTGNEMPMTMLGHFGFTESEITMIGVGELISAILFLIPKTSSLGTLLLSAFFGGAIASHMAAGAADSEALAGIQDYTFPAVFLVITWAIAIFRNPQTLSSFKN